MILRKPYAFLLKHFRLINAILLAFVVFVYSRSMSLYSFSKDYVSYGLYSKSLDPIQNYISGFYLFSLIFILILSITLLALLRFKSKPIKTYVYLFIVYAVMLGINLYALSFFNHLAIDPTFQIAESRVVRDLLFIITIPEYPALVLLVVRAIGLDLKSFGFQEDKDFVATEDDREEFEIDASFDPEKAKREFRKRFRYLMYYVKEHKLPIISLTVVLFVFFSFNAYRYIFVSNKIYSQNEYFSSNAYRIAVNNTYLTDKDYTGKVISKEGKYFVVIDTTIVNMLNMEREFDLEQFLLFVGSKFYVPTVRFNSYFTDLGKLYESSYIGRNKAVSYNLIFEIDKPKDDDNFYLAYQNLSNNVKPIRLRIKVVDISEFKKKDEKKLMEDITIPLNEENKKVFSINSYEFLDRSSYVYEACYSNKCLMEEGVIRASSGKKILFMKLSLENDTIKDFRRFVTSYGKIRYKIGTQTFEEDAVNLVSRNYRGNFLYLSVNDKIVGASEIEMIFTVRSYQYYYKLK